MGLLTWRLVLSSKWLEWILALTGSKKLAWASVRSSFWSELRSAEFLPLYSNHYGASVGQYISVNYQEVGVAIHGVYPCCLFKLPEFMCPESFHERFTLRILHWFVHDFIWALSIEHNSQWLCIFYG